MASAYRATFKGETNTTFCDIADGHARREATSVDQRVVEGSDVCVRRTIHII
jgi:hypothetical protein